MQNVPQIGYVGPLAPIIAAVMGALITAIISYSILHKRKAVTFWIARSIDITFPPREGHSEISFRVGGREFTDLNRASIFIKNTGNTSIPSLEFDIEIPGEHQEFATELITSDHQLRKSLKTTSDEIPVNKDPKMHVSVSSFFNATKSFEVLVYFDHETRDCNVYCRMEDVKSTIKRSTYVAFFERIQDWQHSALIVMISVGISLTIFAMFLGAARIFGLL